MKRILLVLLVGFVSHSALANIHMSNYRWRNDNGTESSATYLAAENAGITISNSSTDNYRLRITSFYDFIPTSSVSNQYTLQYRIQGSPAFIDVPSADPSPFVLTASPFVTNGTATTSQLSHAYTGAFVPGYIITTGSSPFITTFGQEGTENEWVLKPGSTILPNTTYEFLVSNSDVIDVYPTLTTTSVVAVNVSTLTAVRDGKDVLVRWAASAGAAEKFVVERSVDGRKFDGIGTVNGAGTQFMIKDDRAGTSSLFYRVQLQKNSGVFEYTNVVKVPALPGAGTLSVYPNPANDILTVRMDAPAGLHQLNVTNAAGTSIKSVTVYSTGEVMTATADISGLRPGVYFIRNGKETVRFVKL